MRKITSGIGDSKKVPRVAWRQLEGKEVLGKGRYCDVFSATLTLLDGEKLPVALKQSMRSYTSSSRVLLHEARVLQVLAGVTGVPRLYGMTQTTPHVLVMSQCIGITLKALQRRGEIRACLTAFLHVCDIVSALHERQVYHQDLHGGNILVSFKGEEEEWGGDVWLVDFGESVTCFTPWALGTDLAQMRRLVRDTLRDMLHDSDQDIFRQRKDAISLLNTNLNLNQISLLVRTILHAKHTHA